MAGCTKRKEFVILMLMVVLMLVEMTSAFPVNSTDIDPEVGDNNNNNTTISPSTSLVLAISLGCAGGVLLIVIAILIIIPTAYLCSKKFCPCLHESKEFRDLKERQKARTKQEEEEEENVKELVVEYLDKNTEKYRYDKDFKLNHIGCRLQRLWFRIESTEGKPLMLSIAPVSKRCAIVLEKETISTLDKIFKLFEEKAYPEVHLVRKIDYVYSTKSKGGYAIIIQDWSSEGSLRDYLHELTVEASWTKYLKTTVPLAEANVKVFGRQILQGLLRFYKRGIVPLGHLHTGNIFVEDRQNEGASADASAGEITGADEGDGVRKVCRVGGYENMLLGYTTRLHRELNRRKVHMKMIDVYLFGHVLYEMVTGQTLDAAIPTKEQRDVTYKPEDPPGTEREMTAVNCFSASSPAKKGPAKKGPAKKRTQDDTNVDWLSKTTIEELTEVLDYIFESKLPSNPGEAINEILTMKFFKSKDSTKDSKKSKLKFKFKIGKDKKVEKLLQKVKVGVPVEQPVKDEQPVVKVEQPGEQH